METGFGVAAVSQSLYGKHLPPAIRVGEIMGNCGPARGARVSCTTVPFVVSPSTRFGRKHRAQIFRRHPGRAAFFPSWQKLLRCPGKSFVASASAGCNCTPSLAARRNRSFWYIADTAPHTAIFAGLKKKLDTRRLRQSPQTGEGGASCSSNSGRSRRRNLSPERPAACDWRRKI